jgi:uncharacterized protein (DUF342 family)
MVNIAFHEDASRWLIATYAATPGQMAPAVDSVALAEYAGSRGFGELRFDPKAVDAFVQKVRRGEACAMPIAERVDARYGVEVDARKMTAWLTVTASHGGKAASAHDAVAQLAAANVREGVDAAAVEAAIVAPDTRIEVARGVAPTPGKDAWLEPLVEVNRQRHPHIDATGHVDFHDLGSFPTVNAGAPVMRRHPPQPGTAGRNVCGEAIPAPPCKDVKFAVRLSGVEPSSEDPDVLVAEITGQPVLQRDGITVEPVVHFQEVDLAAGNIDFPGSVEVRGDIRSGMKVHAGGDVTVHGVIESAEVSAGGDVKVHGGIIGHAPAEQTEHRVVTPVGTAIVKAQGNVSARFVENALIEAQQTVRIAESVVQSEVNAIDQVIVGGKGKKGKILGGLVRATGLISADHLGGEGASPTRVIVGINPLLQRAMDEHRARLDALLKQHDEVTKVVKLLQGRADKRALYDKARLTLKKVSEDIAEEMEEQRVIEAESKLAEHAKVVVGESVAAGVTVVIGRRSKFISEAAGRGVFDFEAGDIRYSTLAREKQPA